MASRTDAVRDLRFLAATTVLVLNDAVLKAAMPNVVTGKLSDIAGLIVLPIVATTLIGRGRFRTPALFAIVALWFSAIQLSVVASNTHERFFEFIVRSRPDNVADPTDLLALPALAIALWILRNPHPLKVSRRTSLLIVGVASLACTASLGGGIETDGPAQMSPTGDIEILIRYEHQTGDGESSTSTEISTDSGSTYLSGDFVFGEDNDPETLSRFSGSFEGCLSSDAAHCFRIEDTLMIAESFDGGQSWQSSWRNVTDNYLVDRPGSTFDAPVPAESVLVLDDDTVIVTTGTGPRLRWTPTEGWDLTARQARQARLFHVLALSSVALFSVAHSSQRASRRAHASLAVLAVVGVGLGAWAIHANAVLLAVVGILLSIVFLATRPLWVRTVSGSVAMLLRFLVPSTGAIGSAVALWYFGSTLSVGVPVLVAWLVTTAAAIANLRVFDGAAEVPPPHSYPVYPPPA